jgi:competence ComEA-like helix-hairpin-helix protein
MPTPAERQALLFLAAIAVVGGGARTFSSNTLARDLSQVERGAARDTTLGARALDAQITAVDSARRSRGPKRRRASAPSSPSALAGPSAPPAPPAPTDVNTATAAELERLPRVGPALAARIVAWRGTHGPFSTIESLQRVRGIGPATARRLAPLVTFSGRRSPFQSEAPARADLRPFPSVLFDPL